MADGPQWWKVPRSIRQDLQAQGAPTEEYAKHVPVETPTVKEDSEIRLDDLGQELDWCEERYRRNSWEPER